MSVLLALGATSSPAWAAAQGVAVAASSPKSGNDAPVWATLSATQRQFLAPLERDWSSIDAARKAKWLEVAARSPKMPADERARIQQRMAEWARLTPAERSRARLNFLDSKQLSAEEKQARWEAYQSLPEAERNALAARGRKAERGHTAASSAPATPTAARVAGPPSSAASTAVAPARPVGATLVQARPGATTVLMNKAASPPAHQQPGQPKIGRVGEVDPTTLLPLTGPQAAASAPALHRP